MEIRKKLFELQQEFVSKKDKRNDFGKYNFRNIEAMLSSLKPLLKERNLVIVFNEDYINDKFLKETIKLIDIEDGEEISNSSICAMDSDVKGMSDSQATGCSITYIRKYCLTGLLGVDDGSNDPDSMDSSYFKNKSNKATKSLTTQEKIANIINEINECTSVTELTALWNKIGKWSENQVIKQTFTDRKNFLKNNN